MWPVASYTAFAPSWQGLHSDCKLEASKNNSGSPRCGTTWSATLAGVTRPASLQSAHSGCSRSWFARRCRHPEVLYSPGISQGAVGLVASYRKLLGKSILLMGGTVELIVRGIKSPLVVGGVASEETGPPKTGGRWRGRVTARFADPITARFADPITARNADPAIRCHTVICRGRRGRRGRNRSILKSTSIFHLRFFVPCVPCVPCKLPVWHRMGHQPRTVPRARPLQKKAPPCGAPGGSATRHRHRSANQKVRTQACRSWPVRSTT